MNCLPSRTSFAPAAVFTRHLLALTSLALLTACNAQKPAPSSTPVAAPVAAPKAMTAPQFSEPGLTAKIVDAVTKQPLEGALIFGYYATQTGGVGGGRGLAEQVRSFETQTDANGVFILPAWNTADRVIKGEAMSLFPMIAIYKPGYEMVHQNGKSIAQWRPKTGVVGTTYELKDNVYDWTKYPYVLQPAKTEQERYFALNDSSVAMMFIGECGWEAYAKTLLAQHNEIKAWNRKNIPADQLNARGYAKPTYVHPDALLGGLHGKLSVVERISETYTANTHNWKCADPNAAFRSVNETTGNSK